jgi:NADH dehydrogenase
LSEANPPFLPNAVARSASSRPRIVIVGGGFGGLAAARALRKVPGDIVLVDRRNFHLFQPLLYQVATGGLSPANIASPLRRVLHRQPNADVVLGEVAGFDVARQRVCLIEGDELEYDRLILAAGATHSYFGNDWSELAPGLKTIEDATKLRSRILLAFERADREPDPERRAAWLSFVIVGAGPTGVELAGALAEISRHTLRHDFRHIEPGEAKILLVDAVDRVLSAYPEDLSASAVAALEQLGVTVWTGSKVTWIDAEAVTIERGGQSLRVPTRTVSWAAGVEASPLGRALAEQTGSKSDRAGRLEVEADLTLPGHPEISVIGDLALLRHGLERPLPGVAPVAMQQGRYVARRIARGLRGETTPPFVYRDRGTLATIGRARAVGEIGRFHVVGLPAWLMWLFVHLMNLNQTENRLLVLLQWAWSYFTFNRSARLITKRG